MSKHNGQNFVRLTLKVQYLSMYMQRGYISQVICNVPQLRPDPRRVTLEVVVNDDQMENVKCYATHYEILERSPESLEQYVKALEARVEELERRIENAN